MYVWVMESNMDQSGTGGMKPRLIGFQDLVGVRQEASVVEHVVRKQAEKLYEQRDVAIRNALIARLDSLGYRFANHEELYDFCGRRVTMVIQPDPPEVELRLDFLSEEVPGTLLVKYRDEITMDTDFENNRVTATMTMTLG